MEDHRGLAQRETNNPQDPGSFVLIFGVKFSLLWCFCADHLSVCVCVFVTADKV